MPGRFNMRLKHSIALPGVPAKSEIGRVIVSGAPRQSGRHHGRQDGLHRQRRRFPVAAPPAARDRVHGDLRILQAAAERITVRHPATPGFNRLESPMFVSGRGTAMRHAAIGFAGAPDRSPCGTGHRGPSGRGARARPAGRRRGSPGTCHHRRAILRTHCRRGRASPAARGSARAMRRAWIRPIRSRSDRACRHLGHRVAPAVRPHRIQRPRDTLPGVGSGPQRAGRAPVEQAQWRRR